MLMTYQEINHRISQIHLRCCGGLHPTPTDGLADTVATIIIVGSISNHPMPGFWSAFEDNKPPGKNPLESWATEILSIIAQDLNADTLFPFVGPPYIPILSWAQQAEPVHPSPFGVFIHPIYGLWHSYRGVLLFKEKIDLPNFEATTSPCEMCEEQPCTSTCPVNAIENGHFDLKACIGFLESHQGSTCLKGGCLARRACPIGQNHQYGPAQANFHLSAFLDTFRPK
jgi:hypothetical protein